MRFAAVALSALIALPAAAGDTAAVGTSVTWTCSSEITGKTGEKKFC